MEDFTALCIGLRNLDFWPQEVDGIQSEATMDEHSIIGIGVKICEFW